MSAVPCQKYAEGIANSVDPIRVQLFAQTCLSENLGTLLYIPLPLLM